VRPSASDQTKAVPQSSIDFEGALSSVIARAAEVLGDREEAMRWLGNPVRELDYATPIWLLAAHDGAERVMDILGRIEHGIW
jgi:putative toxin-antitoxin system antitoxin component (TIGR02293 family)